jgi:hypothetical protein
LVEGDAAFGRGKHWECGARNNYSDADRPAEPHAASPEEWSQPTADGATRKEEKRKRKKRENEALDTSGLTP